METTKDKVCPYPHLHTTKVDFNNYEFISNPFPAYALLREESPIHRVAFGTGQEFWLVTKYEDALKIFKDTRFTKSIQKAKPPVEQSAPKSEAANNMLFSHHLLNMDPPDHTRMRQLIQKAFTPKLVEAMRPRLEARANELLDKFIPEGKMDIINDYALPLPISIISELLGIPRKDQNLFRRWSNIILNMDMDVSPEERFKLIPEAIGGFTNYLYAIFEERRKQPENDLITSLLQAKEDNEMLNERELMSTIFLLFAAGYETSVNLIGNGVLLLLQNEEQLNSLRKDPNLIQGAIDEILRHDPPVLLSSERYPLEDVEINGTLIPKGDLVLICMGSANRDENRFENPDSFDITRKDNKHLSFGHGIHYCIGASLGKLEGEIAINTLLSRIPHFSLAEDKEIKYKMNSIMRSLQNLHVVFKDLN
jgi:cytochrome P450